MLGMYVSLLLLLLCFLLLLVLSRAGSTLLLLASTLLDVVCVATRVEKLCDAGGLCGEDFTDPRRQAATAFTDQLVTVLKEGPKPLKLRRPGSYVWGWTSTTLTDRILDDFRDDFLATSIFENIENLKPRLAKIVADFGGFDKVASLVGMKRHEKVTEDLVFDKLRGATKTKWRNTRHLKKGGHASEEEEEEEEEENTKANEKEVKAKAVEDDDEGSPPIENIQPEAAPDNGTEPGPSGDNRDAGAGAALPAVHQGMWQALLDDNDKELQRYTAADGHLVYLQECDLVGKTKGCFLVGACKKEDIKPEALGAGLLLGDLDDKTADGCTDLLVIGRAMAVIKDLGTVHIPPTGQSFALNDRPLRLFQKVRWPIVGLLAVKGKMTAVQWAMRTTGLSKKQLDAVDLE
ncbi:hypothetical protein VOLCADRAFT_107555 [Volvox carteri f. nagariensis]|uniref:Uncharacterized protein n=1 Tax=Volvox carteri f. nagariensis TaxID=3068 RepID=D8UET0_VOLCA|nr:uncharacterized protein VOLCADRAFT_107555 [Volvox carteri f. nagariensis]EFJ41785.1 hypothetical protein VOLCADRAFT_107555 [Volvox carteri f. nagariensis]|eukprot:XP_002957131.1 hypothetical protein VOLCADRAFT_107555 [Volvox carteri f. nagariensis]